jgi:hypothetical protein
MTESARDEAVRLARESGIGSPVPGSKNAWVLIPDELVRLIALARQRPGWVWVPKQWTTSMAHAGYLAAEKAKAENRSIACTECGEIYNAMIAVSEAEQLLAAAPKPGEGK